MAMLKEKQAEVEKFWDKSPCDSRDSELNKYSKEYFLDIERKRYELQPHIPGLLDKIDWRDKKALEIGTGVGTDSRNLINRGAVYTGINVDQGSVDVTRLSLDCFNLSGTVERQDATQRSFAENSFDVVYSFGVLHHIPEMDKAITEIHRILKPGGEILVMLYNRSSINYYVEIMFLRKLFLRMLCIPGLIGLSSQLGFPEEKLRRHREIFKRQGKLNNQEWLSRNTDGPDNPYSTVYTRKEAQRALSQFEIISNEVHFFNWKHWGPLGKLLPGLARNWLGNKWGWHRVVHARKP